MRRSLYSLSLVSVLALAGLTSNHATAASGGPDAFGYRFDDQDSGVVYDYIDITATGTMVVSGSNLASPITMGAPFQIYGVQVTDMVANTNGFLSNDPLSAGDLSNDCPLPDPPSTGGGFRIYALHDFLDTTVYYEYFDELTAAVLGYPGQTAGISVFQWVGAHGGGGPAVDFEVVLFHDDFSLMTMVADDGEGGLGSTMGIQDPSASAGLTYACNTPLSALPGVTAVRYSPGAAPDSDCCSASPTMSPGCTDDLCQPAVCTIDPACCEIAWDAVCAATGQAACQILCGAPPLVTINEIRTGQTGPDNDEYFELAGPPGTVLTDIQYIVLGDTPSGEIEVVIDLSGSVIPPTGLLTVAEGSFTVGAPPDLTRLLNFEDSDTVTHMLVGGLSAAFSQNLDLDFNGVLDFTPWVATLDTVALVHPPSPDLPYGPVNPLGGVPNCGPGPLCQQVDNGVAVPSHVYRCPDGLGPWQIGNADLAVMPRTDSPGNPNPCGLCSNGVVDPGEQCDDTGESATCDIDCTAVMCGDAIVNATAGEECDHGVESTTCDTDCTLALCGDGAVNATAGEGCDDGTETAACNADCTLTLCGDGYVNATAGELCDGGGESVSCNVDCTPTVCGDGVTNMTAGEGCDDAGESAACNADCTPALCGDGHVNATAGEECDSWGESVVCDDDCTLPMCGDGVVNTTAGETCDDGGRSDMCDDDCTAVSCGDGFVNAAAGEECDDGSETSECDADCTLPLCGDGIFNAAAGEECDDSGESSECDDDCTPAECGDGDVNFLADEECDDGNTEDGDGCSAECTDEEMGTDDSGGLDSTAGDATSSPLPGADTTGDTGDIGGDSTSGGGTFGATPSDEGCGCTTPQQPGRGTPWALLFITLGIARRRRR